MLQWCGDNNAVLLSNNAKDFESLHEEISHAGLLLYYTQDLPDDDPEGLARTVGEVLNQYSTDELANSVVDLDEWHEWLSE